MSSQNKGFNQDDFALTLWSGIMSQSHSDTSIIYIKLNTASGLAWLGQSPADPGDNHSCLSNPNITSSNQEQTLFISSLRFVVRKHHKSAILKAINTGTCSGLLCPPASCSCVQLYLDYRDSACWFCPSFQHLGDGDISHKSDTISNY